MSKKLRKKKAKTADIDTIFRYFHLLEQNDNMSQTAREIGIDRSTLYKYKQKYWDAYLEHKREVVDQVHDVQAVKLNNVQEFNQLKSVFTQALKLALQKAIDILNDEEKLAKMSHRDLVQLINVISPYAAEKLGITGTSSEPQNMKSTHTTFVQNIIEQMNIKGYKKQKDDNKQD